MAHEIQTLLTNKIRNVECQPVSWNKAEIWQRINDKVAAPKGSYRIYYYAAASVAFFFFNVLTLQQPHTLLPETTDDKKLTKTQPAQTEEKTAIDNREIPKFQKLSVTPDRLNRNLPITSENKQPEMIAEPVPQIEAMQDLNHVQYLEVSQEVTTHEERITPIVGVIYQERPKTEVVKSKRKKILHLKSTDKEFDNEVTNTLIIARIK